MPVFRNHTILGVARNLRAFLDLKVGVTRGVTLKERAEQQERQLHQADQQIKKMRQWLNNKDEQLNTLRAKLGNEQTPVAELKAGLASTHIPVRRTDSNNGFTNESAGDTPVFFLMGRSKSGTGWLMQLLNFHPEVMCRGEGHFWGREKRRKEKHKVHRSRQSQNRAILTLQCNIRFGVPAALGGAFGLDPQRGHRGIVQWRKHRKGVAGDWKNVFTERDKDIFKEEAGDLLVNLGYEESGDW